MRMSRYFPSCHTRKVRSGQINQFINVHHPIRQATRRLHTPSSTSHHGNFEMRPAALHARHYLSAEYIASGQGLLMSIILRSLHFKIKQLTHNCYHFQIFVFVLQNKVYEQAVHLSLILKKGINIFEFRVLSVLPKLAIMQFGQYGFKEMGHECMNISKSKIKVNQNNSLNNSSLT